MSIRFTAHLFYGMPLADGEMDHDEIDGFNGSDNALEIVVLGDEGNMMLVAEDSHFSGDKFEEAQLVKVGDMRGREVVWRSYIVDSCAKNGFTFAEPDWYFATAFS